MRRLAAMVLAIGLAACSAQPAAEEGAADTVAPPAGATTTAHPEGATTAPGDTSGPTTDAPPPVTGGDPLTCWAAPAAGGEGLSFEDATEAYGLVEPLLGMQGHAAAWGDVDGDDHSDLFVGTFATARGDIYGARGSSGPSPDRMLLRRDGFVPAEAFPEMFGRTSGSVIVDLDGDGRADLVLARNVRDRDGGDVVTQVLRNEGEGRFTVADSGIDPGIGGRSIGVLDFDEDGLLDLVIVEDHYRGGNTRLYRNLGDLRFEDATGVAGFPQGVHGLGIATGDLDGDGHTELFIGGSNRLFAGTGAGFTEVPGAVPEWVTYGNEDDVAGAAIADLDRDGRPDLVVGHHFNSTHRGSQVPVRLYLNRTETPGDIRLEDVTEAAGLIGLPTKAPHVDIVDLDNDGWPDILTTASADGGTRPAVFRHLGVTDGIPRFAAPDGLGELQYWVTGPTADVDRDGRVDVLLVEWYPELPSLLLRNTGGSGHWLEVSFDGSPGGGVGTRVEVYEAGGLGDPDRLLGTREIVVSFGYTSGVESAAHFGLGGIDSVDVRVIPPNGADPITLEAVAVDRHIRLPDGCR